MLAVTGTTDTIQVVLAAAHATAALECNAFCAVHTTGAATLNRLSQVTNGTTDVNLVTAAAVGESKQVKHLSIANTDTVGHTVTIKMDIAGVERRLIRASLAVGESLTFNEGGGWQVFDAAGTTKRQAEGGTIGRSVTWQKTGTAPEAVGVMYSWGKDAGFPGAWSPGTPGVNGRATDGNAAADAGCLPLWLPATGGGLYLVDGVATMSVAGQCELWDVLWVNTGLGVILTTAQVMTPVTIPPRDMFGATNGDGVEASLLVTTATTQAAALTATISYTNSAGVAGKTGNLSAFPATAAAGTVVAFALAAGDKGVRSVQSITLGGSAVAGSISLMLATRLPIMPVPVAFLASPAMGPLRPGIRLWTGATLLAIQRPTSAVATNVSGSITVMER